jgi:hypothetical protein
MTQEVNLKNRAVSLSLAFGLAVAALAGCGGAPDGQDPQDLAQGQEALDFTSLAATPVAKTAVTPTIDPKVVVVASPDLAKDPAPTVPPRIEGCERYDAYTAALAELTIACTGTIGPRSFSIVNGVLKSNFETCNVRGSRKVSIKDVKDLLALQHPAVARDLLQVPGWKEAPTFQACFAGQWQAFLNTGVSTCPNWYEIGTLHKATPETVKTASALLPRPSDGVLKPGAELKVSSADPVALPKENLVYVVKMSTTPQGCRTAESCAEICASGLPGFFVESRPLAKDEPAYQGLQYEGTTVIGDPLWWLDPTYYAPDPSPYMTPDFYHPMSFYRNVPGAIFAHLARETEACSFWNGAYHMIGVLQQYCIPGTGTPGIEPPTCPSTRCQPGTVVESGGTL